MNSADTTSSDPEPTDALQAHGIFCAALIREHLSDILGCWEERVKVLPCARKLEGPGLLNHIPDVLDRIADHVEALCPHHGKQVRSEAAVRHAVERYEQDFDLASVVIEMGMLRSCILAQVELVQQPVTVAALRLLDEAIDHIVTDAIEGYAAVRERTVHVFDQIATAALDSRTLEHLVGRLLQILVESSLSIDTATLREPEGDGMRVRAAISADKITDPVGLELGVSVADRVVCSRQPFELHEPANDPRIRALYAIPLIDAGKVVAVLEMVSLTADGFSLDDKRLLRAVGARATAAIVQHMLREAAERSTRELREREEQFHVLADNIPQFAWMADAAGNAYWYNQRWLDYSGATLEEMLAEGPMPFVHPDHVERVHDTCTAAHAAGQAWQSTFPLRSRNGSYRWYLCRAIPIRGESGEIVRWFGTHTDVTEQRFLDEATKVLNSSLDYEETLQQVARLAVPELADWCVVDLLEGREIRRVAIASAKPDALQFAQEWIRKYPPVWDADIGVPRVIRTGDPILVPTITDQQLAAAARDPEHLRDLRELHLGSCIIAPLTVRGRVLGAVTLVTSESNRSYGSYEYEVAKELARRAAVAIDNARLYKDSQHALRERAEAVQSREDVLAIVSHDLRGPLNAIGMSTSLLRETYVDPESSKRLEMIQRSADRMEHMIDDLLDVATIEAKGLTLHRTIEDADRIVAAVVETHEPMAASAGIQIGRDVDLESVHLSCDRERVERVFANLIGNAIKFCRPGDVITVRGHVTDGLVVFSVADTGPGIPADEMPHLFDRYWTSDREGTKGTGLGLYICKGIIEAHGGSLWAASVVGTGTTFFFTLPLAEHARARMQHEHPPSHHP